MRIGKSHNLHHEQKLLNMYNPRDYVPWFVDLIRDVIEFEGDSNFLFLVRTCEWDKQMKMMQDRTTIYREKNYQITFKPLTPKNSDVMMNKLHML